MRFTYATADHGDVRYRDQGGDRDYAHSRRRYGARVLQRTSTAGAGGHRSHRGDVLVSAVAEGAKHSLPGWSSGGDSQSRDPQAEARSARCRLVAALAPGKPLSGDLDAFRRAARSPPSAAASAPTGEHAPPGCACSPVGADAAADGGDRAARRKASRSPESGFPGASAATRRQRADRASACGSRLCESPPDDQPGRECLAPSATAETRTSPRWLRCPPAPAVEVRCKTRAPYRLRE